MIELLRRARIGYFNAAGSAIGETLVCHRRVSRGDIPITAALKHLYRGFRSPVMEVIIPGCESEWIAGIRAEVALEIGAQDFEHVRWHDSGDIRAEVKPI